MSIAEQVVGAGLGLGIDLATTDWKYRKQLEQQRKMQDMQIKGQVGASKELADYNAKMQKELALSMWRETGPEAERKRLEDAGLSVGLMYGKAGGGGGATASSGGGSVSTGTAEMPQIGMGMQMGMQAAMQKAQIENINANTENTKADTVKKTGVDTQETEGAIAKLAQETSNAAIQGEILNYEKAIKGVEADITNQTQWDIIKKVAYENWKLQGEAEEAMNEGKMSTEAYNELLKQTQQTTVEQQLRMGLIKQNIKVGQAQVQKITADILNMSREDKHKWASWEQAEKERWLKEKMVGLQEKQTEFNTSTAAQLKQYTEIITDILKANKGAK